MKDERALNPSIRTVESGVGFHSTVDWMMAALFLCFAVAAAFYFGPLNFFPDDPDFNPFAFVSVILGLFTLRYAIPAIRGTMLSRRFGKVVMEMDGHTVVPGAMFTGVVRVPLNLKPLDDYELRLRCVEQQVRSTQKGTRIRDVIRWEETQRVNSRTVTPAEGVVFAFKIPADALAVRDPTGSLDMNTEGTVRWILEVKAPLKGLNFYAIYGVDVRAG